MLKINDVVEVYKWNKPKYLGKVVGPYPIGSKKFYKVSVLTPIDGIKDLHRSFSQFSKKSVRVDIVAEDKLVRVCNGAKANTCDDCKHRFACFSTW